jgi:hypothetical protein
MLPPIAVAIDTALGSDDAALDRTNNAVMHEVSEYEHRTCVNRTYSTSL